MLILNGSWETIGLGNGGHVSLLFHREWRHLWNLMLNGVRFDLLDRLRDLKVLHFTKKFSFMGHLWLSNHLRSLLIIGTWKEYRIFKTEWALFRYEPLKCLIFEIAFILLELFNLWNNLLGTRIGRYLKAARELRLLFMRLSTDVKISKNVGSHGLKWLRSISIVWSIWWTSIFFNFFGGRFLLNWLLALNVRKILKEFLIFNWV